MLHHHTFWDRIVSGFKPARIKGLAALDIQPTDRILLVGEGTGLDFECLPEGVDMSKVKSIDFSSSMVGKMRRKAPAYGVPIENCTQGDAQNLEFDDNSFDKIFFPLSLASIPNPERALQEAERVLAPGGKIALFEKLIDDGAQVSVGRRCINIVTNCIFADITRNLTRMIGTSPLKIVEYETLQGQLDGCTNRCLSGHYRLAVLTRKTEYLEHHAITAQPRL